jgi:hypothetical protein
MARPLPQLLAPEGKIPPRRLFRLSKPYVRLLFVTEIGREAKHFGAELPNAQRQISVPALGSVPRIFLTGERAGIRESMPCNVRPQTKVNGGNLAPHRYGSPCLRDLLEPIVASRPWESLGDRLAIQVCGPPSFQTPRRFYATAILAKSGGLSSK